MSSILIRLTSVDVEFPIYNIRHRSLRHELARLGVGGTFGENRGHVVVKALEGLNFDIHDGDRFGLMRKRVAAGAEFPGRELIVAGVVLEHMADVGGIADQEPAPVEDLEVHDVAEPLCGAHEDAGRIAPDRGQQAEDRNPARPGRTLVSR